MLVAPPLASGTYPYVKFLFLLRLEKTRIPIPDIQFRGHQPVGLLQPGFAFQISFRVVFYVENDSGLIACGVLTLTRQKLFGAGQGWPRRHFKIPRASPKAP